MDTDWDVNNVINHKLYLKLYRFVSKNILLYDCDVVMN